MFWNDRTLIEFVGEHYPDFLATFCSYKQRGAARRRRPLSAAASFRRRLRRHRLRMRGAFLADHGRGPGRALQGAVIAFPAQAEFRGLPYLLFNGTMASPPGHPFWLHLLSYLPGPYPIEGCARRDGPCRADVGATQLSRPGLARHPSVQPFHAARSRRQAETATQADGANPVRASLGGDLVDTAAEGELVEAFRRATLSRPVSADARKATRSEKKAKRRVDPAVLDRPPPAGENIAVLVPVRDAAEHIAPFLSAIQALDYPKDRIKLVFCEGDSRDGSWERAAGGGRAARPGFRDIVLLQRHGRHEIRHQEARQAKAAARKAQRARQGAQSSDRAWARRQR